MINFVDYYSNLKFIEIMKKILLSLSIVLLGTGMAMAQTQAAKDAATKDAAATKPATTLTADNMKFKTDVHDFGTIPEGPTADFMFEFTNTGKEPITLERAQPSCGCTTPTVSKEPVLPGKTSELKVSYNTQGRVGPFTKTITVFSNAGTKVLTIKGTVEKAPASSVPENNSMIKTN
jgi:hypothetical protein